MSATRSEQYSIGVDIGGTTINIGIVDYDGHIITQRQIPTGPDFQYTVVIDNIVRELETLLQHAGLHDSQLDTIGVGVPGTTISTTGIVEYAPNIGWEHVPFADYLQTKVPFPIYMAQDSQAGVLAEYLFGAGRGCESVACVTVGTGIGCGIILQHRLYTGSFHTAGELGHTLIQRHGNHCQCGQHGCVEAHGSATAIKKQVRQHRAALTEAGHPTEGQIPLHDVFALAANQHPTAARIITEAVEYLGMGLVALVNILGPEKIVITGGLSNQDRLFIEPLRAFVKAHAYAPAARRIAVEKAALGEYAPLIGAAMLSRFVEPFTAHDPGLEEHDAPETAQVHAPANRPHPA